MYEYQNKVEQLNHEWYIGELSEAESILIPAARYQAAPEILRDYSQYWLIQHQDISQGGFHPLGGTVVGDHQSILSYIYTGKEEQPVGLMFVLGADDPEMRRIQEILEDMHCSFQYATQDGKRVHPGNAYKADPIQFSEGAFPVLIECEPIGFAYATSEYHRIDHHRPGDPGYDLPPSQFLEASSLGQLAMFLDIVMALSQDDLVLAAMDHCPANAIQGECPGVTAEAVIERKVEEISKATNTTPEDVREHIAFYEVRLTDASTLCIGNHVLSDLRDDYLGEGYSLDLLAAQVAILARGYTVLLRHRDTPGRPEKWSISGHASPELIKSFIEEWAPSQGLTGIYGVPNRGYAGGYLP